MDRIAHNRPSRRLAVETLESRTLLAGHSAAGSLSLATSALQNALPSGIAAQVATALAGARNLAASQTVLVAQLQADGGAPAGNVGFHSSTLRGQTNSQLALEVHRAAPNTTFEVAVNGTRLGTVTTNAKGIGYLLLQSNPRGSQPALPAISPPIAPGSVITLLSTGNTTPSLTGVFDTLGKRPTTPAVQPVVLKALLTGGSTSGTGIKGIAVYHSVTANGKTSAGLDVAFTGAQPNSTLDVTIGSLKRTVRTDAQGRGIFHLSDSTLKITEGSVITIGPAGSTSLLMGTFSKLGRK